MKPELSVVVVGAGVVGASVALALRRDGHRVTLIDREGPCAGASFGNAGAIVNGSCTPTAMPGIVTDALRMLGRRHSPLSIRPAYLHKAVPWLVRFALESRRSRVIENARNLHALTDRAVGSWRQLTHRSGLGDLIHEGGWLTVYESEHSFEKSQDERDLMDANNVPYEVLFAADIQDLEGNLAPIFERGVFRKNSLLISNPFRLIQGMVDMLLNRGGEFRRFDVQSIDCCDGKIKIRAASESLVADKIVIATGAWSKSLAAQVGNNIPLETERGYHLMLPARNSGLLSRPVYSAESSFVLTPMESGLRLAGLDEFAGVEAAPDYRRIRRLLPEAKRLLPGIEGSEESVWMGCRPSLPDSLPVIGFAAQSRNILYAFGHQHLGMTLGPATGLIIADLVAGRNPGIDLAPYRPDRF
ncbi:MAG: FAD-dependent oxidoreductase [Proteobacteria bacterium]|nr:FAD-dependent oxidoreductase [Pseudomonadota bacterium]